MNIDEAKKELYHRLKKNYKEVVGAGIRESNGSEFIVIFISVDKVKAGLEIPTSYKGNTVKTEISPMAKAM